MSKKKQNYKRDIMADKPQAKVKKTPAEEELEAQFEAFKAEGIQSRKSRLAGIKAQQSLVMNDDYLAFATAYRDITKVIAQEYAANPTVVLARDAYKKAGQDYDAVKKKECPNTYVYEQRIREIKKAVVSLLGKGEVQTVGATKVETVQIAIGLLLSTQVQTVKATA
jgi:hypothetical protein